MSLLTIVVPTYNQAESLPGALVALHGQGELVIVDDCSTDSTRAILGGFCETARIVKRKTNGGTAAAVNSGMDFATTQWVTWQSSDNFVVPNGYATLLKAAGPGVGVVYSAYWWTSSERCFRFFRPYSRDTLVNDTNCYFGPMFAVRRDVWQHAGPQRGRISHDYDHWLRIEESCEQLGLRIVGLDVPLCWYMAHDKRATILMADQYDAHQWQAEARKRRGLA